MLDRSPDARHFEDLVSGRQRGLPASVARGALRLAEVPYTLAVAWRNRRFDTGRLPIYRPAVPVVSVGNLTLGGTGKTPCVAWIARWFRARDVRVAILSRGYGAQAGRPNDEALELEQQLPDVPHLQHPDRSQSAHVAVDELDMQILLLDDGFQHRRLARDLDLVLLDALAPFGHGHVFPRGLLREPPTSLARAQLVALSRADMVDASSRAAIRQQVAQLAPSAGWLELAHHPQALLDCDGTEQPIAQLASRPVAAFCGLGNPEGFRRTLTACGCDLRAWRVFPDHHAYQRRDVEELSAWAEAADVDLVLCTGKDLVKLGLPRLGRRPLAALQIGLRILAGGELLEAHLSRCLPPPAPAASA